MYQDNPHADAFRCRGRPPCLPIRIAPAAAVKKGRHRGLPLRASEVSPRVIAHPNSPRVASGRCSCKPHPKIQPEKLHPQIGYRRFTPASGGQVPPARHPRRLSSIHPRPRRIGILGAPTSSSAHDSAPPARDRWSTRPYVDSPPPAEDRYPGSADVLVGTLDTRPAWPKVDPVGHMAALQKSGCTVTTPTQTRSGVGADPRVCPSGSSLWLGLRRADTGVCPYALRSVDKPGKPTRCGKQCPWLGLRRADTGVCPYALRS